MSGREISIARKYHESTKHTVWSVQTSRHYLDWNNKPALYKNYLDLEPIPLPGDLTDTGIPAIQAVSREIVETGKEAIPSLSQIAYLLYYSAGITKKLIYTHGEHTFRAAASAGALYPVEIYLACCDLPGLPAGVYHFSPADFALRTLRQGDWRAFLDRASGGYQEVQQAPLILLFTAITWRSAWKYQARSYRYHFWDAGTILANSLAACAAQRLPARVVMGFVDEDLNSLLGIGREEEKGLCLFPVGWTSLPAPEPPAELAPLNLRIAPLSDDPLVYQGIEKMHIASSLHNPGEVSSWRSPMQPKPEEPPQGRLFSLETLQAVKAAAKPLEEAVLQRGSSRRFLRQEISFVELSLLLETAIRNFQSDWLAPNGALMNDVYLNVHAVDGLPAGAYIFRPQDHALQLLKTGNFRSESAFLCLGQDLGGDSSATLFFLADLEVILERYGNRGYRLAQMEAGLLGGKLYLSAYALGRGATGLTFYDNEVVSFFSPHAEGKEAMFVTALGAPGRSGRRDGRMIRILPGESRE